MAGVAMPDESRLPPGPLRDLTTAIHELYAAAGRPGVHKISAAVQARDDLPDSVSHETVRAILRGQRSSWGKVECLVRMLAEWSVERPDVTVAVRLVQKLWHAAQGPQQVSTLPADPELLRQAVRGVHGPTLQDAVRWLVHSTLYVPRDGGNGLLVAATPTDGRWLCAFTSMRRLRAYRADWAAGAAAMTGRALIRTVRGLDVPVGVLVDPAAPGADLAETLPVPHPLIVELDDAW